jgi:hypothetical protein
MRIVQEQLLSAVDAAQASQTSAAMDARQLFAASGHVVATGTDPVGALKFQASNDNVTFPTAPTNWVDIPTITVSVTAAGQFLIPKFDLAYGWIRAVYTKTSGTGAITLNFTGLGF